MRESYFRRHTIIAGQSQGDLRVIQLERDWFSYSWAAGWPIRHVFETPQGQFHVVSNDENFTRENAAAVVDNALTGKICIIDLREMRGYAKGGK